MTSTHLRRLSDKLNVSFIVLEVGSASEGESEGPIMVQLTEKGQILAAGDIPSRATIFLLYNNNHFDVLVPVPATTSTIHYKWDHPEPVEPKFFKLSRMAKDHACGWSAVAVSLNTANVPIPKEYKEPAHRSISCTSRLLTFFLEGTTECYSACFLKAIPKANTTHR